MCYRFQVNLIDIGCPEDSIPYFVRRHAVGVSILYVAVVEFSSLVAARTWRP